MRAAAIDIGTNSVLLLIGEVHDGEVRAVLERATITRLGEGVDASGELAPLAIARTERCLREYAEEIARHQASRVVVVATSAMRDVRNGDTFLERARELLGVVPEVVTGKREAELTFEGALVGLSGFDGRVAVFDVGGGSTEIIVGRGLEIESAVSIDVGAVRLTERHVHGDPPLDAELAAVRAAVRAALADAPAIESLPLIGVAGTVTTLAALVHDVAPYDPARIHGSVLTRVELQGILERLQRMTIAERRELGPLDPGRADVIVAGAIVVDEIARAARAAALVVSDRGVRWGLLRRMENG